MNPSIYRLRLQDILTLCILALLALGLIMVQSASMNLTGNSGWRWTSLASKHMVYVLLALATYFTLGHIDYARLAGRGGGFLRSPIVWMFAAAMLACFLVLIPGIGRDVNGARRWIPLGITQIQPSELAKWGVVLFLAWGVGTGRINIERLGSLLLALAPVGVICLLVVIEDFGTAALIGMATLALCVAGRARLWHLLLIIPPALAAAGWFIMHKEYRWRRMTSFLDPFASPEGEGYHMIQSLLAFANGGLSGKGLGRGVQKLGYLPEDTTDFIFSVICEEMGLFGALLVIALYLGILYVAWQAIRQKKDSFGQLLAFGIGTLIGLQALINIAVATVSIPPKGMSLPLVSFGGSGLIITSAALGLLHSVCRHSHEDDMALESQPRGFEVVSGGAMAMRV